MKANPAYLLESLSNNDVTFFIPPYQRNYEWSSVTCTVFLEDIQKVTRLNKTRVKGEHFFGSVVYVVEESGFGTPDRYVLTDGQQRITTTMLFLMALRDVLADEEYATRIQQRYIENDRAEDGTEFKIKLKQVETDWQAYKLLALKLDVPAAHRNSAVYQNYRLFYELLIPLPEQSRKDLLELGLSKFSIIAIQLEPDRNPWENPQEIFESMNSLGKPLSLADLVRNYLLMGRSSREQNDLYNKYWLAFENRLPGRLSEFIRDWMQALRHESFKVARENNFKELYSAFKSAVLNFKEDEVFVELSRFSLPYSQARGLDKTGDSKVDQTLEDLRIIGASPAMSLIAEIIELGHSGSLNWPSVNGALSALRTYLLRRRIIGLTTAENQFFPVLGARLGELQVSGSTEEAMFSLLRSGYYALRLPNDQELRNRLSTMNFYNLGKSKNYPKLLLSLAEAELTKSRPAWDDANLQLEHIMPQALSDTWIEELGPDYESVHQDQINLLGNLTLIRHNQELGNSPFAKKKAIYEGKSGLQITQNMVIDQSTWNARSIDRRNQYLVDLLTEQVLRVPDHMRRASNWNQDETNEGFDIRQILNQLIGEAIQFVDDPRVSAIVESDSKVSFEGKTWALSPLTTELKKRAGDVSDSSNFHGGSNWMWDDTRLTDLEL